MDSTPNELPNDLAATQCQSTVRAIRQSLFFLGCLLAAVIGCQRNGDEAATIATNDSNQVASDSADREDSAVAKPNADEKVAEVEAEIPVGVQFASWEEAEQIAKSAKKITVLDIWSTVCAPCIKELPGLVDLHQELGDQVQCMTLDVDFDGRKSKPPTTYEKDVLSLLTNLNAKFPNYICTTSSDDVYSAAEIDSIPAVLIFDADGKLAKKFVDAGESAGFGYHKDVIPFVKSLLESNDK
jgi:thiol-disulfide isomerase/thioredoxin